MSLVIVAALVIKRFPSHCGNCVTLECGTSPENIIEVQLFLLSENKAGVEGFVLAFKAWPVKMTIET